MFSRHSDTGKERLAALKVFGEQKSIIERLYNYKKGGYLKLEPVDISPGNSAVLFLLDNNALCGVVFNPSVFIKQQLESKMKSIAGDEFILAVYKSTDNNIILSTDRVDIGDIRQTNSLWLLPQYNLGITLKGRTIDDLVRARTTQNLILIAGITALIIIGISLISGLFLI